MTGVQTCALPILNIYFYPSWGSGRPKSSPGVNFWGPKWVKISNFRKFSKFQIFKKIIEFCQNLISFMVFSSISSIFEGHKVYLKSSKINGFDQKPSFLVNIVVFWVMFRRFWSTFFILVKNSHILVKNSQILIKNDTF